MLLSKTVNPRLVGLGDNVIYTLAVTNEGPSIITSVVVTDTIPATLSFVTASTAAGGWVYNNSNLLWNVGTLSTNGSATLQVTATAYSPAIVTNEAYLGFAEGELNFNYDFAYAFAYFLSDAQRTLSAALENHAGTVLISWPQSPAGLQLQANTDLSITNGWTTRPIRCSSPTD